MGNLAQSLAQGTILQRELSPGYKEKEREFSELYARLEHVKNTNRRLQRHVPAWIRERIERKEKLSPGLEEKEGVVIFSDLSGFTTLAETLSPDELIEIVQRKFAIEIQVAQHHALDVQKFFGDATLFTAETREQALPALEELLFGIQQHNIQQSVGASFGQFHQILVGEDRLEPLIAGPALHEAFAREKTAATGEILLTKFSAERITTARTVHLESGTILDTLADHTQRRMRRRVDDKLNEVLSYGGLRALRQEEDARIIIDQHEEELKSAIEKEARDSEEQNTQFARLLSPSLVHRIQESQREVLGLEQSSASILYIKIPARGIADLQEKFLKAREKIERGSGEIDKLVIVDPQHYVIMATFGRTTQSPFHRQEAMRTARSLQDILENSAMGIATGNIISGTVGYGDRQEFTVTGDAVNLAARIAMTFAEQGTIWVPPQTLVKGFTFGDTSKVSLKGKKEKQQLHKLVGEELQKKLYENEIIGRDEELKEVRTLLTAPHRLAIEGQAGIGKSRFCFEIEGIAQKEGYTLYSGACFERDREIPYRAVANLLKNIRHQKRKKEGSFELGDIARFILGENPTIGLTQEEVKERLLRELEDIVRDEDKIIFYFRDTHWIDAASRDIMRALDQRVTKSSIWYATRPEKDILPQARKIALGPLDQEGTQTYAAHLFAQEGKKLSEQQAQVIAEKSEGIPLYIEEVVRFILEGTGDIATVGKVSEITRARFSQLGEESREVAKVMSVMGMSVDKARLKRIFEEGFGDYFDKGLEELLQKRFLEGEQKIFFHHALTHDVVYNHVLVGAERQGLHNRIAEYLKQTELENNEDLAFHYERADTRKEGIRAKAAIYKRKWGLDLSEKARGEENVWMRALFRGDWQWNEEKDGPRTRVLRGAYELATGVKERAQILEDLIRLAINTDKNHVLATVNQTFEELLAGAGEEERREIPVATGYLAVAQGLQLMNEGKLQESVAHFKGIEERIDAVAHPELKFLHFANKNRAILEYSIAEGRKGSYDAAIELALAAVEDAMPFINDKGAGDLKRATIFYALGMLHRQIFVCYTSKGDKKKADMNRRPAIYYFQQEREISKRLGIRKKIVANAINLAWTYYYSDQFDDALALTTEGRDLADSSGFTEPSDDLIYLSALCYFEKSLLVNGEERAALARESQRLFDEFAPREEAHRRRESFLTDATRFRGLNAGILGDITEAERCYRVVYEGFRATGAQGAIRILLDFDRKILPQLKIWDEIEGQR